MNTVKALIFATLVAALVASGLIGVNGLTEGKFSRTIGLDIPIPELWTRKTCDGFSVTSEGIKPIWGTERRVVWRSSFEEPTDPWTGKVWK